MGNLDYRIGVGMFIHLVICLLQLANPDLFLFYITLLFVLLNILGLIFIVSGKEKIGCILFMIGSAGFIPIGMIGIFGARSMMNKRKEKEFYEEIKE